MSDRYCPFCSGGGLARDGEHSCDACGGSGKWVDALVNVATEVAEFLAKSEYRDTAFRRDLDVLLAVRAGASK